MSVTIQRTSARMRLERRVLKSCSSELYWDIAGELYYTSDEDCRKIIACHGDYRKECATFGIDYEEE